MWKLKRQNNDFDIDSAFDFITRCDELTEAIKKGATVILCISPPKYTKFFGTRSLYLGYCSRVAAKAMQAADVSTRKGRSISHIGADQPFTAYFAELVKSGWRACMSASSPDIMPVVTTPEGYALAASFDTGAGQGWFVSPPTSASAANQLVLDSLGLTSPAVQVPEAMHGIFLSHTSADKPFVRKLRDDLVKAGAQRVWVDEAEIHIGDSLIAKIEDGLNHSRYVGVVLSSKSIDAPWVKRELEIAITKEIKGGQVVVLPLLYEKCDMPAFLQNKMYADFTDPSGYDEALAKVIRRLKV